MILVIVLEGKHDHVYATYVMTFDTRREAEDYCASIKVDGKYWIKGVIVKRGEPIYAPGYGLEEQVDLD